MKKYAYPLLTTSLGITLSIGVIVALNGLCRLMIERNISPPQLKVLQRIYRELNKTDPTERHFEIPNTLAERPFAEPQAPPQEFDNSNILHRYPKNYSRSVNSVPIPNTNSWGLTRHVVEAIYKPTNQTVYRQTYTFNSNNYRETPSVSPKPRKKFALFLGDSVIFGEGIPDHQTIPAFFEKSNTLFRSYNLGFHGYGPNDILARAYLENTADFIGQDQGVVLYTFFDFHIERLIGSMKHLALWGAQRPYFYESSDGRVHRGSNFQDEFPVLTWLAKQLWPTATVQFFKINFPFRYSSQDYHFLVRVVEDIKREYLRQLPGGKFYFVFYPSGKATLVDQITPFLEQHQIQYLDYSKFSLETYTSEAATIPWDGHPTAAAHKVFGEQLSADLMRLETRMLR